MRDYRNLERGWTGGTSETYTLVHNYYYNTKIVENIDRYAMAKEIFSTKTNIQEAILILEVLKEYNTPANKFICDSIKESTETIKEKCEEFAYNKIIEYINKQITRIKYKSLAEIIKQQLDETSFGAFNKKTLVDALIEKVKSNIKEHTPTLNKIIKDENKSKSDEQKLDIKSIKEEIEFFCMNIKDYTEQELLIEFHENRIEYWTQILGIEIEGNNQVEGAFTLMKKALLK